MAIGQSIQRYPLLRLFVSFVSGIALADVLYPSLSSLAFWGLGASLLLLLFLVLVYAVRSGIGHTVYGFVAVLMFFSLGIASYSFSRDDITYHWSSEDCIYEAEVIGHPRNRSRSVLCTMNVTAVLDSSSWHTVQREVFVYMQPTKDAELLLPGDVICFRGTVRQPTNFSEDLTFDYARYVTMQGGSGTIYLPQEKWMRVGTSSLSLRERMECFRHKLEVEYMHKAFSDDTFGVLAAISLGDKHSLSDEIRAAYTDAGVAHALALSGLHVSVIYAMIAFLMSGMVRRRSMRWLRELSIIIILWLFALLVGLSASVVRAVSMCTLYILARWLSGENSSINVLTLAALVMLLVNPLYLFDVGFQLSFMAMAAILWLEPHLENLFHRRSLHPLIAYLIGIVCMSLVAQLGTFPLSLYHFGTFPVYFLVTNLLVIPYLNIVLLLSVVWWILVLTDIPFSVLLGEWLESLTLWMNACLTDIGHWPTAVLHIPDFNLASVLFTYLLILFVGLFLIKKWPRGFVFALAALLGLLLSFLC